MKKQRIPIPVISGEYKNVYVPKPCEYKGKSTKSFKNGETYQKWITNDFSVIKDGNKFHMVA